MLLAFDLDDTLFKEMDYVASVYRAVAARVAPLTTSTQYQIAAEIMAGRPRGFEAIIDKYGITDFSVDDMVEMYRAHYPDIYPDEEVVDTLAALKSAGHTLVLITDGSTRHQRAKLKALGLEEFFDDVLISQETGGDKTTTVPWLLVEERYGYMRRVYVGDNMAKDFHLPGLRGWHTVMLRDADGRNVFPQKLNDFPAEYRPQMVIDNIATLLRL